MRQIDAKGGLTPTQERFVLALLQHPSVKAAAAAVGIAERTARSYMSQADFRAAYAQAKQDMLSDALELVQLEAVKSLQVIVNIRDDESNPGATRLKAAHILGSRLTDIRPPDAHASETPLQGSGVLVPASTLPYITNEELDIIEQIVERANVRKAEKDKVQEEHDRDRQ